MTSARKSPRQFRGAARQGDLKVNAGFGGPLLQDFDRSDIAPMARDHARQFVQNSQTRVGMNHQADIVVRASRCHGSV
jgi:hypothetical protein